MVYRLKWLALGFVLCGFFAFSQEGQEQRIRSLEQKTIVIEDFLKNRLQQLEEQLERQRIQIQKLGERDKRIERELVFAQKKLRNAESEIIKLQIELKTASKEKPLSSRNEKPVPKQQNADKYTNSRVKQCAQKLTSSRSDVRMGALLKLANIEHNEAIVVLVSALRDKDPYVQMLACKILARKKSAKAIPSLFFLLQSPNREVRCIAEKSLKKLTDSKSSYDPDKSEKVRTQAINNWRAKIGVK